MTSIDWTSVKQIAVLRALFLGDLLCAVPALRALRRAAPQARIALLGLPWAREFCDRFSHYVNEFVEFPGFPGLAEQRPDAVRIIRFLSEMQARRFDLAIQLHGSGAHVNEFVTLLGARRAAGFYLAGSYCPEPECFMPYPQTEPEVRRHLRLMAFLGAPATDEALEFPIRHSDGQRLSATDGFDREAGYICIHPGGKLPTRRWPPERFAAVADSLAADGFQIVLTGVESERPIVDSVERRLHCSNINLCGRTDLGTLATLLRGARLVVTNDTGVSHLAVAVRAPSVVVGLGSDLARWAPLGQQRHRVVARPMACRPCEHIECPIGFPCAEGVSSKMVLGGCRELLDAAGTKPRRRQVSLPDNSFPLLQEFARCDA